MLLVINTNDNILCHDLVCKTKMHKIKSIYFFLFIEEQLQLLAFINLLTHINNWLQPFTVVQNIRKYLILTALFKEYKYITLYLYKIWNNTCSSVNADILFSVSIESIFGVKWFIMALNNKKKKISYNICYLA